MKTIAYCIEEYEQDKARRAADEIKDAANNMKLREEDTAARLEKIGLAWERIEGEIAFVKWGSHPNLVQLHITGGKYSIVMFSAHARNCPSCKAPVWSKIREFTVINLGWVFAGNFDESDPNINWAGHSEECIYPREPKDIKTVQVQESAADRLNNALTDYIEEIIFRES